MIEGLSGHPDKHLFFVDRPITFGLMIQHNRLKSDD